MVATRLPSLTHQSLIHTEGRKSISRQMKKQNEILHHNIEDLKLNIEETFNDTKRSIDDTLEGIKAEYDLTESLFLKLDKLYGAVADITDALSNSGAASNNGYIYHPISDNTPDFQHISAALSDMGSAMEEDVSAARGIKPMGLMKLFKTHLSGDAGAADWCRVYTVCSLSQLSTVMTNDW